MVEYAHITWRVQLLGTMFGGLEEWSTGFYMGNTNGGDIGQAPSTANATAVATAWSTFFTDAAAGFSQQFKTIGAKISLVAPNGQSDPANTAFYYYPSAISGASGGGTFPPQVSLVATLTTARVRGYGSKGRMFLPGINFPIDTTGHMGTNEATAVKTKLVTFLNSVNANTGGGTEVVLNSALSAGIPGHPALMEPITGVRIGNVYDTQRRRRNQLQEAYIAGALT